MRCPDCGYDSKDDAAFCESCGAYLLQQSQAKQPNQAPSPTNAYQPPNAKQNPYAGEVRQQNPYANTAGQQNPGQQNPYANTTGQSNPGQQNPHAGTQQRPSGSSKPYSNWQNPYSAAFLPKFDSQSNQTYQQPDGGYQETNGSYQQSSGGYQEPGGGYQQPGSGYQQPGSGYQQNTRDESQIAEYRPIAISSMVFGILSYALCMLVVFGFVFGGIALSKSKRSLQPLRQLKGPYGFALAGKITGIVGIVGASIAAFYWIILIASGGALLQFLFSSL